MALSSTAKSVMAISAPSEAYFNAIALPIPRAAPVTTATFPFNKLINVCFLLDLTDANVRILSEILYILYKKGGNVMLQITINNNFYAT